MAATRQQKIDSLATKATVSGEFHIEPFPKLGELIAARGLKQGAQDYDEAMERARIQIEQAVNKSLRSQDLSPGNPG